MITLIRPLLMIDTRFLYRVIVLSLLREAIPQQNHHEALPKQNLLEAFRLSCYRVIVLSCYRSSMKEFPHKTIMNLIPKPSILHRKD